MTPKYQHNCPYCKYIGTFNIEGSIFDIYLHTCPKDSSQTTILARYGNECGDYFSTIISCFKNRINESFSRMDYTVNTPVRTIGKVENYELACLMGISKMWIDSYT